MKTDWKDDIFTQRKIRLTENSDGTVTPEDATDYTHRGDSFGAKELNEIGTEINEVKKSVSDGKALVAAAITAKRVATAATATFKEMAANIGRIVLGSGNAQPADVRKGKTFTNDEGVEKAGTMPEYISGTKGISCGLNDSGLYYYMGAGYWIQDGSGKSWVYMSRDEVAATIGLNPDCMLDSINVLGKQGKIQSMAGVTVTPQTYAQTVWSAWKRMTGNVEIAAVPLPPAYAIKKGYRYWIGSNYVDGTCEGYFPTPDDLYLRGNNPAGFKCSSDHVTFYLDHIQIFDTSNTKSIDTTIKHNLSGHAYLKIDGEFCNGAEGRRTLTIYKGTGAGWYSFAVYDFAGSACTGRITIAIPLPANLGDQLIGLFFGASITGNIYHVWLE